MLSSCSKVTVAGQHGQDSSAITFTDVAAKSVVTGPSDIGSFSVWGWRTDNSSATPTPAEVFSATEVSRTGTSWTYEGTRYWMPENTYDFYALYPDTATLTAEDRNGHKAAESAAYDADGTLTITGFDSTKGHDLMTASRTGMSGNTPQTVGFTFSHELVRLSFKVHAENAIVVSACLYGVNYGGTLKKEKTSEWTELEKAGNAGTTPFRGNDIEFVDGTADLFGEILILPHKDLSEARLDLTFKTSDTGPEKTLTYNLSNTDVSEWTAGKSYGYNVILSGNMDLTVTVSNWVIQDTVVEW